MNENLNNQAESMNKLGRECNDGDEACIGDRWCVCKKGEWVPTGKGYYQSDSTM